MIVDLERFVAASRPRWRRLEQILDRLEADPACALSIEEARELHGLFERTAAELSRLRSSAAEHNLEAYLGNLVARAYSEIHETRRARRLPTAAAALRGFARTFRRHAWAFGLAVLATTAGAVFGAGALLLDPDAKAVLMPFPHLRGDPSERVAEEEASASPDGPGHEGAFSAQLATHNTRVAVLCLALGMTFGVGTLVVLFFNGAILGAVIADYLRAQQGVFLAGWLLPHGVIEIPAVLIGGQAGLILARALLDRRSRLSLAARLRAQGNDLTTLIAGVGVLLVWAGLVEAFFSQLHQPVLPYAAKITFGLVELALLAVFLARAGRGAEPPARARGSNGEPNTSASAA